MLECKFLNEKVNSSLRVAIVGVLCFFSLQVCGQSRETVLSYIEKYKKIALDQERKYGVPAPVTLAQGLVESGAGNSKLTLKTNNHFGIKKGTGWDGPTEYAWDTEPSYFRVYRSAEESYEDHSKFLRKYQRYNFLFNLSVYDYRGWAHGLLKAGYAGSPDYAKALIGYIDAYQLYNINGGVKLRPGKTVRITKTITKEELSQQKDIVMEDTEESDEQIVLNRIFQNAKVEINHVRCTILFPGESIYSIAMKYDISPSELFEYNEITSENEIREGDIVFLGKKKNKYKGPQDFYTVKEGETLYSISQLFGIKLASLEKMNHKDSFSSLEVGEKLVLK